MSLSITPTASELLGAYQLGVVTLEEVRETFGFEATKKQEEGN